MWRRRSGVSVDRLQWTLHRLTNLVDCWYADEFDCRTGNICRSDWSGIEDSCRPPIDSEISGSRERVI